jgi:hypothetical protein
VTLGVESGMSLAALVKQPDLVEQGGSSPESRPTQAYLRRDRVRKIADKLLNIID